MSYTLSSQYLGFAHDQAKQAQSIGGALRLDNNNQIIIKGTTFHGRVALWLRKVLTPNTEKAKNLAVLNRLLSVIDDVNDRCLYDLKTNISNIKNRDRYSHHDIAQAMSSDQVKTNTVRAILLQEILSTGNLGLCVRSNEHVKKFIGNAKLPPQQQIDYEGKVFSSTKDFLKAVSNNKLYRPYQTDGYHEGKLNDNGIPKTEFINTVISIAAHYHADKDNLSGRENVHHPAIIEGPIDASGIPPDKVVTRELFEAHMEHGGEGYYFGPASEAVGPENPSIERSSAAETSASPQTRVSQSQEEIPSRPVYGGQPTIEEIGFASRETVQQFLENMQSTNSRQYNDEDDFVLNTPNNFYLEDSDDDYSAQETSSPEPSAQDQALPATVTKSERKAAARQPSQEIAGRAIQRIFNSENDLQAFANHIGIPKEDLSSQQELLTQNTKRFVDRFVSHDPIDLGEFIVCNAQKQNNGVIKEDFVYLALEATALHMRNPTPLVEGKDSNRTGIIKFYGRLMTNAE